MIDIQGCTVTLMVADVQRAHDFYATHLGFAELYRGGDHFRMLERAGLLLGIHARSRATPDERGSSHVSIGFRVEDIHTSVQILDAAGVRVPGGVVDDDGAVLRAEFTDPDGTALYLIETRRGGD